MDDPDIEPCLSEPLSALAPPDAAGPTPDGQALRSRLMARLAATRAAEAAMVTVRHRASASQPLAPGVQVQALYRAPVERPLRPGEPRHVRLLRLQAGARLWPVALGDGPSTTARHREWLVLSGQVALLHADGADPGEVLGPRDYHVTPAGLATPGWRAESEALLFLRESDLPSAPGDQPHTVRDAQAGWPDFAPGIQRRVLWARDGQAALLYYTQPGASVPLHEHGHDEECLMVQGELFLDDLLLQAGDYQLAPAGTGHRITETDTGVVIYAHGDLDLRFVA